MLTVQDKFLQEHILLSSQCSMNTFFKLLTFSRWEKQLFPMLLGEWCSQQIPGPAAALKLLCWSLHTLESSASELWFAIIRIFCFPLDHTRWNNSKHTEAAKMAVSDISGSLCLIAGVKQVLSKGDLGHIVKSNRSALLKTEQMWQTR